MHNLDLAVLFQSHINFFQILINLVGRKFFSMGAKTSDEGMVRNPTS